MLKLMRADFYKIFHRAYFFVMMLVIAALCVLLNISSRASGEEFQRASFSMGMALSLMAMPVVLAPMITQIVSDEDRDHTLKNTVAFGSDRVLLYASKWLTALLLYGILAAAALGAYFGSMAILLQKDPGFTGEMVQEFFTRLAAMSAVYAACVSLSTFFSALFRNNGLAFVFYYGSFYLANQLLFLVKFSKGTEYTLKTQADQIIRQPLGSLPQYAAVSLVTMALFFAAGAAVFRRKDVI